MEAERRKQADDAARDRGRDHRDALELVLLRLREAVKVTPDLLDAAGGDEPLDFLEGDRERAEIARAKKGADPRCLELGLGQLKILHAQDCSNYRHFLSIAAVYLAAYYEPGPSPTSPVAHGSAARA